MKIFIKSILTFFVFLFVVSCANIGRPSGGPIDRTPPHLIASTPMQNQTSFKKKKIEIEFDEIVLVENAMDKVTVSPPQKQPPLVTTSGRRVFVELKDSLKANTTYTVDFSDAIVDNNEKNPFNNFALSFSTGKVVDSLEVSGRILNASDLEPITGIYVGLHKLLDDSAFVKRPFDRVTRSDVYGKFSLKNVAPGQYRIYGLKDANRDYKFDQPGEDIAFSQTIIVPTSKVVQAADTVFGNKRKGVKDSIRSVQKREFYPNDILLMAFNENFKSQYLDKSERKQRNKLTLQFAAPAHTLPILRPLNFSSKNWAVLQKNPTNDTLNYWIKDSLVYSRDTLFIEAKYLKTDSLKQLSEQTDTLKFLFKTPKVIAKKKKKGESEVVEIPSLSVDVKAAGELDIYQDIQIDMPMPIDTIFASKIRLEEKKDTVWHELKTPPLLQDSLNILHYSMQYKWVPEKEYRLSIDSAAIYGFNGLCNKPIVKPFKVKSLEVYSGLFLKISGVKGDAFVELLNESDKPLRQEPVINGVAEFYYVMPGTYYIRVVEDHNSNFKWDTGNFEKGLQPEPVFYYQTPLLLRANWDIEQEWNVQSAPIYEQKPLKLVKNKPKEKKTLGANPNEQQR